MLVNFGRWNIHSQKTFELIYLLMEFQHLFQVFGVENILWLFVFVAVWVVDLQLHWEWVRDVNNLSLSITCSKDGTDYHRCKIISSFFLLWVVQQIREDLWLNYTVRLLCNAHAKVEIGFNLVRLLYCFHIQIQGFADAKYCQRCLTNIKNNNMTSFLFNKNTE